VAGAAGGRQGERDVPLHHDAIRTGRVACAGSVEPLKKHVQPMKLF
jgi:hypothetical protein